MHEPRRAGEPGALEGLVAALTWVLDPIACGGSSSGSCGVADTNGLRAVRDTGPSSHSAGNLEERR